MGKNSHSKLFLIQILGLFLLGLWSLFAKGLPDLDSSSMIDILPQLFPIIISAFFLFLLPLFHPEKKLIYIGVLVLSLALIVLNLSQLFQLAYAVVRLPLSLLIASNLIFVVIYSFGLRTFVNS